jgi:hypothetical protein
MSTPGSYFSDPNEKLLADVVWDIAGDPSQDLDFWEPNPVNAAYLKLPHVARRVVLARDWITSKREWKETGHPADGGVYIINDFFKKKFNRDIHFTAEQIGNVEHFYVAAMQSDVGGLPLISVTMGLTALWEFTIGPLRITLQEAAREGQKRYTFPYGTGFRPQAIIRNWNNNVAEFKGPNTNGWMFGQTSGAAEAINRDIVKYVQAALDHPDEDPLDFTPADFKVTRSYTTGKGDTLSGLAERFYQDAQKWPLIWKANLKTIGTNYNVVKEKTRLDIPLLYRVSAGELAEARRSAGAWRPGLDWR